MSSTPRTGSRLAPALDLFRRTVTAVDIRGEGALQLIFDDGAELHVSPHPEYESWTLTGVGIEPITAGPGGQPDWHLP